MEPTKGQESVRSGDLEVGISGSVIRLPASSESSDQDADFRREDLICALGHEGPWPVEHRAPD